MAGIDELKAKTKLSMDEMFDDQVVVKLENQEAFKKDKKETGKPGKQLENLTTEKLFKRKLDNESTPLLAEDSESKENNQAETRPLRRLNNYPTRQATVADRPVFYKATFNLPEDIHKELEHLYARRMLQGCKTAKSDLICEAIEWLVKMEGN